MLCQEQIVETAWTGGEGAGSRPPPRVCSPAVQPRAGAHSSTGRGHSSASPTLTERPLSFGRGRRRSLSLSPAACGPCSNSANRKSARSPERFGNLPKVTALECGRAGIRSHVFLTPSPALGKAGTPCAAGLCRALPRSLIYRERGVCVGVRGCVGVYAGERRGLLGSRGNLPKFTNFQPAIPLYSAGKAPLASSPQRKPELCAAPEPERPDAVQAVSKVRGSQAGESAGTGRKGAAVSPGEAGARPGGPAGRRAGEQTRSLAGRQRPLHPQQSSFQTENKSPQSPSIRPPAARSPRRVGGSPRPLHPAQRATQRPGLPL